MKLTIKYIALILVIFAFSCGNNKDVKVKNNNTDSTKNELNDLNTQLAENPKDASLLNKRAIYYLKQKDVENAFKDINQAVSIDAKNSAYLITMAQIYFAMGKVTDSRKTLLKANEVNPEDINPFLKLAEITYKIGDYKKVFDYVAQALKIDQSNSTAYYWRGLSLLALGDTTAGVNSFQKAVDNDSKCIEAYTELGNLYALNNKPIAEDYYNNALKIDSLSVEAIYGLAMYYQNNEKYEKAISLYNKILKITPNEKYSLYNIGYVYLIYSDNYDGAIDYFNKTIAVDPQFAQAYFNRGYAYELKGDKKNALADYRKALEIKPDYKKAIKAIKILGVN